MGELSAPIINYSSALRHGDGNGFLHVTPSITERESIDEATLALTTASRESLKKLISIPSVARWLRGENMASGELFPASDRALVEKDSDTIFLQPALTEELNKVEPYSGYWTSVMVTHVLPARIEAHGLVRSKYIHRPSVGLVEIPEKKANIVITIEFPGEGKLIQVNEEAGPAGTHQTTIRFRQQSEEGEGFFTVGKFIQNQGQIYFES